MLKQGSQYRQFLKTNIQFAEFLDQKISLRSYRLIGTSDDSQRTINIHDEGRIARHADASEIVVSWSTEFVVIAIRFAKQTQNTTFTSQHAFPVLMPRFNGNCLSMWLYVLHDRYDMNI